MPEPSSKPTRHPMLASATLAAASLIATAGCHQHYHYYNMTPGCPPSGTVAPSSVQFGSTCDVPVEEIEAGNVDSSVSPRSTTVEGSRNRERVVVSQPRPGSVFSWRKSDPDAPVATTSVEGGLDDTTIK
jgi:hypothetical protein